MSLVETFHLEHKARLARLGGIQPKSLNLSIQEQQELKQKLIDLQARIDRQKSTIADLNSTVVKQRNVIRKFADEDGSGKARMTEIITVIAEHFNFTRHVIIGSQRTPDVIIARHAGYLICREYGFPVLAVGRAFNKDHSSVVHGSQKIAKRLLSDSPLRDEIQKIKNKIEAHVSRRVETIKEMMA